MEKTLVVSDLDGTLLTREDALSPFTLEALQGLMEGGLLFSYATARSFSSASKVVKGLSLTVPVIVYNGAFLVDPVTGKPLVSHFFSNAQKEQVAVVAAQLGLSPLVYGFVENRERVSYVPGIENPGRDHYLQNRQGDPRLRSTSGDSLYQGEAFYFTFIGTKAQLSPVWEAFHEEEGFICTFQQELYREEFWLELMPKQATKAQGLQTLQALLGCDKTVVFGDAINDIPLFQAATYSYAVKNAVPALKAIGTDVIGSNEEDGVAKWLLEHVPFDSPAL